MNTFLGVALLATVGLSVVVQASKAGPKMDGPSALVFVLIAAVQVWAGVALLNA